ncbi:MAG TPA: sugar ABC transporter permease [Anaerolineales bacterium]|nr:sugar ABC transporter permease [Anaerolineales bacterium]
MATKVEALNYPVTRKARKKISIVPYLFIGPHLLFFAAFLGWPFLYGIYISLFRFDFLQPNNRPFVGLKNYANLFDPKSVQFDQFWNSLSNTGEFILWSVLPLVGIALVLAVLLNRNYPGRGLFRTIFFAPYTLSVTVASVLWWWIFQQTGIVNEAIQGLGLKSVNWLGDLPSAWIAITICTIWWTIGFNTIIFLTALQEIPASLYEAASLDGANARQQFFLITLPMLRSVLVFVLTITLIASANLFGQPYLMTKGGPADGTQTVIYRIFFEGLLRGQMGIAAAMSIFVALLLLVLTYLNFKFFGQTEER